MKTRLRKTSVLIVALAVALVPAASFAATATVRARSSSWGPARLEIKRGDTVKWTNSTGFLDHSVKSIGSNWTKSATLSPGTDTSFTFRTTGRFRYRCTFHSRVLRDGTCEGMCGQIKVSD